MFMTFNILVKLIIKMSETKQFVLRKKYVPSGIPNQEHRRVANLYAQLFELKQAAT